MIAKSKRNGNLIAMKRKYSRRHFIVKSAMTGVGLALVLNDSPSLAQTLLKNNGPAENTEPMID